MIIKQTTLPEDAAEKRYVMVRGSQVRKMSDLVGESISVVNYMIYNENDNEDNEDDILTIETDNGMFAGTNSPTFIKEFRMLVETFKSKERLPKFKVLRKESKKGRQFMTLELDLD